MAATDASPVTVIVRLMAGAVFLSEGIQKFLFPGELAAGRFAKIGIPFPEVTGPFVGGVEIAGGALLLAGLFTRPAALVLLLNITVAIVSTKLPILLGEGFWGFHPPEMPRYGFWAMAHAARTDFCMFLGCLYLVLAGGGRWSLDARLFCRRAASRHSGAP